MSDLGLIFASIGQGLSEGVDSYNKSRALKLQEAYQKGQLQNQRGALREHGLIASPEGGFDVTPERQAEEAAQTAQYQQQAQEYNHTEEGQPDNNVVAGYRGLLESVKKGTGSAIPKGTSVYEAKQILPLAEKIPQAQMAQNRFGLMEQGMNLRTGKAVSNAANQINSDSLIKTYDQAYQRNKRAIELLQDPAVTPQEFSDALQEYNSAIAGGNAGLGKLERTEYAPYETRFQKFIQDVSGQNPKESIPPAIRTRVLQQLQNYDSGLQEARYQRAQDRFTPFPGLPEAEDAQKQVIERRKPQQAQQRSGQGLLPQGATGQHKPGDIVSVKGKNYRVGADGDSLEPVQ
jgi:hypothetical protein